MFEPSPEGLCTGVFLAERHNVLFGGTGRNVHRPPALYVSQDDAQSIRFQFIDQEPETVKDRQLLAKASGSQGHAARHQVWLQSRCGSALASQKGLLCGMTTHTTPGGSLTHQMPHPLVLALAVSAFFIFRGPGISALLVGGLRKKPRR